MGLGGGQRRQSSEGGRVLTPTFALCLLVLVNRTNWSPLSQTVLVSPLTSTAVPKHRHGTHLDAADIGCNLSRHADGYLVLAEDVAGGYVNRSAPR